MFKKFIFLVLIIITSNNLSQGDKTHYTAVNSAESLISKTSTTEVVCSINRSYYAVDDTIDLNIKITSCSDTSLMLSNPDTSPIYYGISHEERIIGVYMGGDIEADMLVTAKKVKIKPGESLFYNLKIPIDSTFKIDEALYYNIDFYLFGWIYTTKLGYLTKGDDRTIDLKDMEDMKQFLTDQFVFIPGQLGVMIVPDMDNVYLLPCQSIR